MRYITAELRAKLSKPQGRLVKEKALVRLLRGSRGALVAVVGDVAAMALARKGVFPNLVVYDLKSRRKPLGRAAAKFIESLPARRLRASNPPGTLSQGIFSAMKRAFSAAGRAKEVVKLFIEGEEDLAVIPAVIAAPLKSIVVYGQPRKGLVVINVTKAAKKAVRKFYSKFSRTPSA